MGSKRKGKSNKVNKKVTSQTKVKNTKYSGNSFIYTSNNNDQTISEDSMSNYSDNDSDEENTYSINDEVSSKIDYLYYNRGKKKSRKKFDSILQELYQILCKNYCISVIEKNLDQFLDVFLFIFKKKDDSETINIGCQLFEVFLLTIGGRKCFTTEKDQEITSILLNKIKQGGIYSTDDTEIDNFEKKFQPSVSNKPAKLETLSVPKKDFLIHSPTTPTKINPKISFPSKKIQNKWSDDDEEDYYNDKEEYNSDSDNETSNQINLGQLYFTAKTQKRISILNSLIFWHFIETSTVDLTRKDGVIDQLIKEFWHLKKENPIFLSYCVSGIALLLSKCYPSQIVNFFYNSKRKKSFQQTLLNFLFNDVSLDLKLSSSECLIICLDGLITHNGLLVTDSDFDPNDTSFPIEQANVFEENQEEFDYIKTFAKLFEKELNNSNQKCYSKNESLALKTTLKEYVNYLNGFIEPSKTIRIKKKKIEINGWPNILRFNHLKGRIGEGIVEHLANNSLVKQFLGNNEEDDTYLNKNEMSNIEKKYYIKTELSKSSRSHKMKYQMRKDKRRNKIMYMNKGDF